MSGVVPTTPPLSPLRSRESRPAKCKVILNSKSYPTTIRIREFNIVVMLFFAERYKIPISAFIITFTIPETPHKIPRITAIKTEFLNYPFLFQNRLIEVLNTFIQPLHKSEKSKSGFLALFTQLHNKNP